MRKTKIIATIGPSCEDEKTMLQMIKNGLNVVRINMSHGTIEHEKPIVETVKKVRDKVQVPLAIMIDTKGPEIRIGVFKNGFVELKEKQKFILTTDETVVGDERRVSVNYKNLIKDINIKDKILLNDGLIELAVEEISEKEIFCKVNFGGKLTNRKSMFVPSVKLSMPFLSEQDKLDLEFACKISADYVAASFVSCAQDVQALRKFLNENGGQDIQIISKIESATGVENLDEIIESSDGIMVARGDLGVELNIEKIPSLQKKMIAKAKQKGKIVITATEMLESMTKNLRPTRAETTDVANAVYDGTSAVMLSGETAMGNHPAAVVKTMSNICIEAEKNLEYHKNFREMNFKIRNTTDAISHSVCNCAFDLKSEAIVVFTLGGTTSRMISRFRPQAPVITACINEKIYNKMALIWGTIPVKTEQIKTSDEMFEIAKTLGVKLLKLKKGDTVVVCAGVPLGSVGGTNLIKVQDI